MAKKEWKPIPGWENKYYVSSEGEVCNIETKKKLIGDINTGGYMRVMLYHKGRRERFFRHRLVASLFIPNPHNYKEVNHINGNKKDNSVSNLEWCDKITNEREARRTGLKEYKPFEVVFMNNEKKQYEFKIDLAKELNVTPACIKNYLHKKTKGYLNKGIKEIYYI